MNALVETRKFIFLGILAAIALVGLYFATKPQNKWVCKNNVWVAMGNPKTERPLGICK